jgi:hypothetical protein
MNKKKAFFQTNYIIFNIFGQILSKKRFIFNTLNKYYRSILS